MELNIGNWILTREMIARESSIVRMEDWWTNAEGRRMSLCQDIKCGTAGCLAGWTVVACGAVGEQGSISTKAAELLGVDEEDAGHAFLGEWTRQRLDKITKAQVLAYIDGVIETGSVYPAELIP